MTQEKNEHNGGGDSVRNLVDLVKGAGATKVSPPTALPDGSGFFTASWPLPKDHWLYSKTDEKPPAPMLTQTRLETVAAPTYGTMRAKIYAAVKHVYRSATAQGTDLDIDPDALCIDLANVLIGTPGSVGINKAELRDPEPENDE